MRVPESLVPLFDYGVLDDVVRPLLSGKEAHVYLVVSGGKYAVAKIYKDAQNRSFKHRAEYTEGRKTRNTRDQRAIANRSKHGRAQDEAAWRSTEVDMIHRLHAAGVRVPVPYHFIEGVLLMELVTDAYGNPAPRLGDLSFDAESARVMYDRLVHATMQMLCAGVIHGDLSEFNVLIAADGPVVIDFPQSVDSARNTNARKLLIRDVDNLHRFLARHVPSARRRPYAEEMWSLHERNLLTPDTRLRGEFREEQRRSDTASTLALIGDANRDERKRRDALGLRGGPRAAPAQQSRGGSTANAPKKEPAVYQGLKDEGLKFFRHLRDPQPGGHSRGGQQQGQRSRGPQDRPQQQQSQGRRQEGQQPPAQRQAPRREPQQEPRPQSQPPQAQRPQSQTPQGQHTQGGRPRSPHPHSNGRSRQPHPSAHQTPHDRRPQERPPQAQRNDNHHRRPQPSGAAPQPAQAPRDGAPAAPPARGGRRETTDE